MCGQTEHASLSLDPSRQGLLVFLPNGIYSLHLAATGQAKFAEGDRAKATPEEYKTTVVGNFSHWGKWSFSETDSMLTWQVEHSMFPNWTGTAQKRRIELSGDELKYLVPNPETAGSNPVLVWKRAESPAIDPPGYDAEGNSRARSGTFSSIRKAC